MANVAIMGFGTVGSGVYEILVKNSEKICENSLGTPVRVTRILDIRDFSSHPAHELFTKEFDDILNDDSISVVVEVMGGINPAYEFTKKLLSAGKSVVTSNKALVAEHGAELMGIAVKNNINYMFEASVGGGIPIIRPLHQCLTANHIVKIAGILNGTTNYILNEMIGSGKSFATALSEAQEKGFAERDPSADIEGYDACRKIAILSSLASGRNVNYEKIETVGITNISLDDVKYASALGYVIKLIGYAEFDNNKNLYSVVSPRLVHKSNMLANVDGVMNAIMVSGDCVGDVMFYGAGAGKLPTASAVVADIVDCVRHTHVTKHILWLASNEDFAKDTNTVMVKYFIRTNESLDNVKKYFNVETVVDNIIAGEIGVITELVSETEAKSKLNNLTVTSAIRIL